ncbi:MAG: hypothetical protein KGY76_06580 [Candidatus Thermoplasmatota archaeon]|nr:hypothetical protein [Candidatus Thermoplasmatota archaeon]
MEVEEIKETLDEELEDTGWVYKYWERENRFELRNTGSSLSEEVADESVEKFIDELDEEQFKPLLTGKTCLQKKGETFLKKNLDNDGRPSGQAQKISEEEAKELVRESLGRIDSDILPTNLVTVDREEIIDIYTERVKGLKLITLNMKGKKMITLRDDGGLQFESQ